MPTWIQKTLDFLNLLDASGKLSISNTAVYSLLVKIMLSPTLDWPTASGLLVTLLNYAHKRVVNDAASNGQPDPTANP